MNSYNNLNYDGKLSYAETVLLFFGFIYFNQSIMFRELFSATQRIIFSLALFFTIILRSILFHKVTFKKNGNTITICLTLLICIALSCIANGFNLTFDLYTTLLLILCFFLVSVTKFEYFVDAYISIMSFLGITSVFLFILYIIMPGLFDIFPSYVWHGGIYVKNAFLCVVSTSSQNKRNFGIFVEPGNYALYLNIAMYMIFFLKKNLDIKKATCLLVTIGTTLSTNGYITCGLLIFAYLLKIEKFNKKEKKRMIYIIFFFVAAIYFLLKTNPSMQNFLLGKFDEINVKGTIDSNKTGSGYERWRSVVYAWETFLSSPIFGVAATGWQKKFENIIGTATPLNWLGLYGLAYGSILNFLYIKAFSIPKEEKLTLPKIIVLIAMYFNILSQNVSTDIIIFMIVLYATEFIKKGPISAND